jgi:hypothetical protein
MKDRPLQKIEAGCGRRYRVVERTSLRAGVATAEAQPLFSAHFFANEVAPGA